MDLQESEAEKQKTGYTWYPLVNDAHAPAGELLLGVQIGSPRPVAPPMVLAVSVIKGRSLKVGLAACCDGFEMLAARHVRLRQPFCRR